MMDPGVAEVPAIPGCYALMPTRKEALAELAEVFGMIAAEYREKRIQLQADTTEIMHAFHDSRRTAPQKRSCDSESRKS